MLHCANRILRTKKDNYIVTDPVNEDDITINSETNSKEQNTIQQRERQNNDPDYYHKDILKSYIDINMALKDASRNCQDKINCDRLAIYVFHNGNKSFHGLPFFKMSCVHEWNRMRINSLRGKSHMNMPLHLFDFVADLYKDGFFKNLNITSNSTPIGS